MMMYTNGAAVILYHLQLIISADIWLQYYDSKYTGPKTQFLFPVFIFTSESAHDGMHINNKCRKSSPIYKFHFRK